MLEVGYAILLTMIPKIKVLWTSLAKLSTSTINTVNFVIQLAILLPPSPPPSSPPPAPLYTHSLSLKLDTKYTCLVSQNNYALKDKCMEAEGETNSICKT